MKKMAKLIGEVQGTNNLPIHVRANPGFISISVGGLRGVVTFYTTEQLDAFMRILREAKIEAGWAGERSFGPRL